MISVGREAGVVSDARWKELETVRDTMAETKSLLKSVLLSPQGWISHGINVQYDGIKRE